SGRHGFGNPQCLYQHDESPYGGLARQTMIEAYLFHAMFAVQIVLASVLIPRRLLLRACENLARNPPAAEDAAVVQLSLNRYRLANGAIAVIGAVLMAFLYFYMAQADWDEDPVPFWQTLYFL